jgi:UDP-N-acetylglucosamine 3-dehydrogenase
MSANATWRIAVIGVGAYGRLQALACRQHPRLRLMAVEDADRDRALAVSHELGVAAYDDVGRLLREEAVDAVIVATPEQVRRSIVEQCAAAGRHLLLEKPLAPTVEECQAIVEVVRRAGVTALVDFSLRFDPRYAAVREAINAGRLGEIVSIVAKRNGTVIGARRYGRWTGLLLSTAIHELDLMRWYAGPVERISAEVTYRNAPYPNLESAALATMRFRSGAIGLLETSWARPEGVPDRLDARCEVVGTAGSATVDLASHGLRLTEAGSTSFPDFTYWPVTEGRVGGALRAALEHFVRCLDGEEPPRATVEDGREAVRLVFAILEAATSGVAIPVHEGPIPPGEEAHA